MKPIQSLFNVLRFYLKNLTRFSSFKKLAIYVGTNKISKGVERSYMLENVLSLFVIFTEFS